MSRDLNQCNFTGRLGRDVDIRYLPSGEAVASFSIAVGWKSKDKEGVEWVNISAFGRLAEICGEYLSKGSHVLIVGRMKTDEKDGKYYTKIIASEMQMLGGRQNDDHGRGQQQGGYQQQQQHPKAPPPGYNPQGRTQQQGQAQQNGNFDDFDDDIPF